MRSPGWNSPGPASSLHDGVGLRARQNSTNTCLPPTLLSTVPSCAAGCVASFVSHNYLGASCANTSDLSYLCTQPNTSGLTIGEGSIQCIVSSCTGQDQREVAVYNICIGIANAQPNTARTITATIVTQTSSISSAMNTLPATIGNPTSTENVSTIVMATYSPSATATPTSASSSTPSSTSMSSGADATAGAIAMTDKATSQGGLTIPQRIGISIGGAATLLMVFGLCMLVLWMRRRRRERRRSQRRSRLVEQTPPPNYQSPPGKASPAFDNIGSTLAIPGANSRFYGRQETMEDKRRSFWRKSIRPEDIGVAVSPKMPSSNSPVSAFSEKSFSLLLPTAPAAALWPAPLDPGSARDRRSFARRPASEATEFADDAPTSTQEPEQILIDNQPFILEKPPLAKRPRGQPPNAKLPVVPESPRNSPHARIPLTPTYDNGNIQFVPPPRSTPSPARSQGPLPMAERKLPSLLSYANRNVLRKDPSASLPLRVADGTSPEPLLQPRNAPRPPQERPREPSAPTVKNWPLQTQRQSTVSSVYTDIEEDTTPEEIVKLLELQATPSNPLAVSTNTRSVPTGPKSPIKDLRYPQIPRSAAVSRQAERPALLRASVTLGAPPTQLFPMAPATRPRRDERVQAGASFVQTDTTSSDGYMSDSTIEFPVPPTSKTRTSRLAQLKNNPSSGNKGPAPSRTVTFPDEDPFAEPKAVDVAAPQRSPSTKARLTPSKSSTGDLYLTVEI